MSIYLNKIAICYILFFVSSFSVLGKVIPSLSFRSYRVVSNVDSLEKAVYAQKNNPTALLQGLITLERTRFYNSPQAGQDFDNIKSLAEKQHLPLAMAMYQFLKARIIRKDNLEESAKLCLLATQYFEQSKDTTGMINCYSHLLDLNTFDAVDKNSKNLNYYYDKIITLGQESSFVLDKLLRARMIMIQSTIASQKKCFIAFKEAINLIDKNPEYEYLRTGFLGNMSNAFSDFRDYKNALAMFIKLYQMGDNALNTQNNYNLSSKYFDVGDYENANLYIQKTLEFYKERKTDNTVFLVKIYDLLARIQFKRKQYQEAWFSRDIKDSLVIVNQEKLKPTMFLDLQTKYQTQQKEAENKLLLSEKKLDEARKQQYLFVGIFTTLGLVIASILLLIFRKNNKKLNIALADIQKLNKIRDQFFGIIAHDLRRPMHAFQGMNEMISFYLKQKDYNAIEKLSVAIDESGIKLQKLLDNLLSWALSQREELPYNPTHILVLPTIKSVIDLYEKVNFLKKISFEINCPADLTVYMDVNALELVLRNLLDNSFKALSQNGNIEIFAERRTEKEIEIKITDNAGGIPKDKLDAIQSVFDKPMDANIGESGLGMGLIMVARFVKKNKGKISVESRNNTSIFRLILPSVNYLNI